MLTYSRAQIDNLKTLKTTLEGELATQKKLSVSEAKGTQVKQTYTHEESALSIQLNQARAQIEDLMASKVYLTDELANCRL